MTTLAVFGLGALCMLVLCLIVFAVWSVVRSQIKIVGLASDVNNLNVKIGQVYDEIDTAVVKINVQIGQVHDKIDMIEGKIYSHIDSKIDSNVSKLDNRLCQVESKN